MIQNGHKYISLTGATSEAYRSDVRRSYVRRLTSASCVGSSREARFPCQYECTSITKSEGPAAQAGVAAAHENLRQEPKCLSKRVTLGESDRTGSIMVKQLLAGALLCAASNSPTAQTNAARQLLKSRVGVTLKVVVQDIVSTIMQLSRSPLVRPTSFRAQQSPSRFFLSPNIRRPPMARRCLCRSHGRDGLR